MYQDKKYGIEVGYWDGMMYLHWFYPKKSWHIRFIDESPFDFTSFKLIVPHDRSYLGEELNQFRAKKFGLITPYTSFVTLFVNAERHGMYWMIEDWSETVLMRNKRSKHGCIFGSTKVIAPVGAREAASTNRMHGKNIRAIAVKRKTK